MGPQFVETWWGGHPPSRPIRTNRLPLGQRSGYRSPMTRRTAIAVATTLVVATSIAWSYQSEIIGLGLKFYLQRVAARGEASGDLTQQSQAIARLHRQLLIDPPPDLLIPELFDYLTQLSARTASGEISLAWGAYLYTSHLRDAVARPIGTPRMDTAQLAGVIQEGVDFYYLQKRPDLNGARVKDLWDDGESFTVEEIEQATREGRDLTRGE